MVINRIVEFEKSQEDGRHVQAASVSCHNVLLPPDINVSLVKVNCSTKGQGDLDTNSYTRPRFASENRIFSTSANLPESNRRSLSVTEGFRGGITHNQKNNTLARTSCGHLFNDAFIRTINSSCSYLGSRFDSVSSDSSVFSGLTNISPIPFDPFTNVNHDQLYSQSSVLSSSSNSKKNSIKSSDKSNPIKKFYEIKKRKWTSQIEPNDHEEKELDEEVKEIKLIVNNSNKTCVDMENGCFLSENETSVSDGIAQKARRMMVEKMTLSKEFNSSNEDDSVFLTTQFNFEDLTANESLDYLLISPVPKMDLSSSVDMSITDLDGTRYLDYQAIRHNYLRKYH